VVKAAPAGKVVRPSANIAAVLNNTNLADFIAFHSPRLLTVAQVSRAAPLSKGQTHEVWLSSGDFSRAKSCCSNQQLSVQRWNR
jgi:hypothetical protein